MDSLFMEVLIGNRLMQRQIANVEQQLTGLR